MVSPPFVAMVVEVVPVEVVRMAVAVEAERVVAVEVERWWRFA